MKCLVSLRAIVPDQVYPACDEKYEANESNCHDAATLTHREAETDQHHWACLLILHDARHEQLCTVADRTHQRDKLGKVVSVRS